MIPTEHAVVVINVAGNPLDENQAIPVLLTILLSNPNLKPGKIPSGSEAGLFHSISNGSVLDEFARVDRSDRALAIEWLTQQRDQACDDAVRFTVTGNPLVIIREFISLQGKAIQRIRRCSVSAVASALHVRNQSQNLIVDQSFESEVVCKRMHLIFY
jgi:hypothetical protein